MYIHQVLAGTSEFSVEMDIVSNVLYAPQLLLHTRFHWPLLTTRYYSANQYSFAIVAWETFTRKEPQVACGTSNLATLTRRVFLKQSTTQRIL